MQTGSYFDFATEFEAMNDNFEYQELPEAIYSDFKTFLEERDFEFSTDSEKLLTQLSEQIKDVEGTEGQLQDLKEAINHEKQLMFEREGADIKKQLFLEIISRYEGQMGKVRAGLKTDPEVIEALNIIKENSRYANLLAGE
jgi:carboxyl-terminal processing protease